MGHLFNHRQATRFSWKNFFYRPMVLAALALHGLVLAIPVPSTPTLVEEKEAEEIVDLTAIPPLPSPTSTSMPSSLVEPTPIPSSIASAAASIPSPLPQLVPVPRPTPLPTPAATPTSPPITTPSPEPVQAIAPSPIPTPTPTPLGLTPEQLQAYQAAFDRLAAQEASRSGAVGDTARASQQLADTINCSFFEQPGSFFTACGDNGGEPQRRPEIFRFEVRPQTRPSRALEYYQENFPHNTFTDTGKQYGGVPLYAIGSSNHPSIYLSLVGFGLGNSTTIAVFWLSDPTQSPPPQPAITSH